MGYPDCCIRCYNNHCNHSPDNTERLMKRIAELEHQMIALTEWRSAMSPFFIDLEKDFLDRKVKKHSRRRERK